MDAFLSTLLVLVHFLCKLYNAICDACNAVYRRCMYSWCANTTAELDKFNSLTNKIPRHLMIIFGHLRLCDESVLDCVRIIEWCISLDISYISFFDSNGFLKKNEFILKEEFARKRPDLIECITWNPHAKTHQNGVIEGKSKINVSLLSDVDNKGKIATLTQSLAKMVSSGNLDQEKITIERITEELQIKGMPDPDLALIRDYSCSTHGVLPWHTRTTEFLMLPLYVNIPVKDFTCLLEKYNKCVQRHGK
ncbi:PREDICTED: dehydrodolichyl diphosphate syntase complex subunit NUS1 [Acromyrmex echinatior]|uniref:ditrans,polycis-polyprenyl diphosphate synthase [(2E,6E)-farnesyldiphosphate specific] n=1 Tax=Acromyrmex echinatior TaxID=103372 RepID=F4WNG5_ACREC|nr:PREDICTED: dehydrodolichyl diphosphate syntase complex subunit NUS1 [Acromyrmex echinatior]XP_011056454.1 PREDICTED: dehydrodolichyl diphosphate syntase complex subunit NUS1 [Acromyrmex echinatior]XP_011056455.1 PREDICTED: dehydrodolichyl diphosphate syntase complex subunit NUS1 [Acromyrmex echinatior]EGI64158.1 Nogo-B receptor [Acromyrmex echinatior]